MKKIYTHYLILLLPLALSACLYGEETQTDMLSVKVRRKKALDDLKTKLVNQPYGWTTVYEPNKETTYREGFTEDDLRFPLKDHKSYPLLLKFFENQTVKILSQVNGFKDDTIGWRLDLRQQVDLVFDTYGIFHHLLTVEKVGRDGVRRSYGSGADFEFGYERSSGDTLHFVSLTDNVILGEAQIWGSGDLNPSAFWLVSAKKNSINQFK